MVLLSIDNIPERNERIRLSISLHALIDTSNFTKTRVFQNSMISYYYLKLLQLLHLFSHPLENYLIIAAIKKYDISNILNPVHNKTCVPTHMIVPEPFAIIVGYYKLLHVFSIMKACILFIWFLSYNRQYL